MPDPTLPSEEELHDLETAAMWTLAGMRVSVSVSPSVLLSLISAARAVRRVEALADEMHDAAERAAASDSAGEREGVKDYLIAERLIRDALTGAKP